MVRRTALAIALLCPQVASIANDATTFIGGVILATVVVGPTAYLWGKSDQEDPETVFSSIAAELAGPRFCKGSGTTLSQCVQTHYRTTPTETHFSGVPHIAFSEKLQMWQKKLENLRAIPYYRRKDLLDRVDQQQKELGNLPEYDTEIQLYNQFLRDKTITEKDQKIAELTHAHTSEFQRAETNYNSYQQCLRDERACLKTNKALSQSLRDEILEKKNLKKELDKTVIEYNKLNEIVIDLATKFSDAEQQIKLLQSQSGGETSAALVAQLKTDKLLLQQQIQQLRNLCATPTTSQDNASVIQATTSTGSTTDAYAPGTTGA